MASLRKQMLLHIGSVLGVTLALSSLAGYWVGQHEVEEVFDAELASQARVLHSLLGRALNTQDPAAPLILQTWQAPPETAGSDQEAYADGHKYEKKLAFQIRDADGRLLARSGTAPDAALAELVPGYSDRRAGTHDWRVFTLKAGSHWYQVADRDDARRELARDIGIQAVLPLVLAFPLLLWLIGSAIRRCQRPLLAIAEDLSRREAGQLNELPKGELPDELAVIVHALNGLFGRLDQAFEREQRFAADAAHELRTPLAALSIHVQNAERAQDDAERAESLNKVHQGLRRAQHVVEQLLALSRVEATVRDGQWQTQDLRDIAQELFAELAAGAEKRGIRLAMHAGDAALPVRGNAVLLRLMLRNVIDNALRYSPEGSEVRLTAAREGAEMLIHVDDEGPGLPEELLTRVFERFFRAAGQKTEGVGLGLSIVKLIADLHGARLHLENRAPQGLRFAIRLPASE